MSKNVPHKQMTSLDEKHSELLSQFHENETILIPKLFTEIEELKTQYHSLPKKQIETRLDIKDQIKEKRALIKVLKSQKNKYLIENSQYIFDYFEQKKQISSGEPANNVTVLNSFFKVRTKDQSTVDPNKYIQSKKLYQDYWRNVNREFTNPQDYFMSCDLCMVCSRGEMVPQDEEGIMICNNTKCGQFITYIVDSSKPNNKDPIYCLYTSESFQRNIITIPSKRNYPNTR